MQPFNKKIEGCIFFFADLEIVRIFVFPLTAEVVKLADTPS